MTQQHNNDFEIINSDSKSETYKSLGLKFNLCPERVRYIFRRNNVKKIKSSSNSLENLTEDQIKFFKENINNYSYSYFEKEFNTSQKVLLNLTKKLKIEKQYVKTFQSSSEWTQEELQILKDNYLDLTLEELANLLNKTERAVCKKKWSLNLVASKNWSKEEDDLLKRYSYLEYDALSFFLERSVKSIKHRFDTLKLKKSIQKETSIERIIRKYLEENHIEFVFNQKIENNNFNFRPDFRLEDKKIIIEVHGDYWHSNPLFYDFEDLTEHQKVKVEKDNFKKNYYESLDYTVIILWEHQILTEYDKVVAYLNTILNV